MLLSHISERYTSQASSSSSEMGGSGQTGGLYLNAYEVSFPLEESVERPAAYHLNQGQQMIEGKSHYEKYIYYVSVNGKKKLFNSENKMYKPYKSIEYLSICQVTTTNFNGFYVMWYTN